MPSFKLLASIGVVTYSPFSTMACTSTGGLTPSLIVTVTVWPSSTSLTVPRTTMAALSPLPLITPSAVLSMLVVMAAVLSSSTLSCALTGLPAISDTLAVAVNVPSFKLLASIGVVTYSPLITVAVVVTAGLTPSLIVTVTIWPSSTSSTVPRTTMAALSPLPLITPSAVLSMLVVMSANLSISTVSLAVASLPAKSETSALATISPSFKELASIGAVTYSPFCTIACTAISGFTPSLRVIVTTWPSSMPLTVPRTTIS